MRRAISLWQLEFAQAPMLGQCALSGLAPVEAARLDKFLDAAAARRFALTRLALRQLLGARLGLVPARLRLQAGAQGKPFCADAPDLGFNISHTKSCALIAIADGLEIGVDVEDASSFSARERLWDWTCSGAERAWLDQHPAEADTTFGMLWTRKEALLKASGSGLSVAPTRLDLGEQISAETGHTRWQAPGMDAPLAAAWRCLRIAPDRIAAVAVLSDDPGTALDIDWQPFAPHSLAR